MNGKRVITTAVIFFTVCLGGAFIWDSVSSLSSTLAEINSADSEMRAAEERFLVQVDSLPQVSSEVSELRLLYQQAALNPNTKSRHQAFNKLYSAVQKGLLSQADPSNASLRRITDEILGAYNRRQISERRYAEAVVSYNLAAKSSGGKIARSVDSALPENVE